MANTSIGFQHARDVNRAAIDRLTEHFKETGIKLGDATIQLDKTGKIDPDLKLNKSIWMEIERLEKSKNKADIWYMESLRSTGLLDKIETERKEERDNAIYNPNISESNPMGISKPQPISITEKPPTVPPKLTENRDIKYTIDQENTPRYNNNTPPRASMAEFDKNPPIDLNMWYGRELLESTTPEPRYNTPPPGSMAEFDKNPPIDLNLWYGRELLESSTPKSIQPSNNNLIPIDKQVELQPPPVIQPSNNNLIPIDKQIDSLPGFSSIDNNNNIEYRRLAELRSAQLKYNASNLKELRAKVGIHKDMRATNPVQIEAPEMNDFIWRPGQKPMTFSKGDILIGSHEDNISPPTPVKSDSSGKDMINRMDKMVELMTEHSGIHTKVLEVLTESGLIDKQGNTVVNNGGNSTTVNNSVAEPSIMDFRDRVVGRLSK
jgi:hypothetical protein